MLAIKKIIAALLLPPGCLILLLGGTAAWLLLRRQFKGGALVGLAALLLYLGSAFPVSERLMLQLEDRYRLPTHPGGDVILLLGGGINEGVADLSGTGVPSADMFGRIVTAARLQKRLNCPIIVSGGAVFEFTTPEAPIDKRILMDLGVPANRIILEDKSRDTLENARFSSEICSSRSFRHPLLVTSAYHLPRAVIACRQYGLKVQPVPASPLAWRGKRYGWIHYLPAAGALLQTSTALREQLGLAFYPLSGR